MGDESSLMCKWGWYTPHSTVTRLKSDNAHEKAFRDVFIAVKPLPKDCTKPLCLDDLYPVAFLEWHHNAPVSYSFFHTLDVPIISLLSVVPYLTGLTLPRKPETFRTWHLADQRCPQRQRLPQPGSGLGPGEADPSNLTFSDLIPPNQLFDLNCLQVKRGSKYQ